MLVSDMEVHYIDHCGSDLSVVNAARVSFDKESEYVWTFEPGEIKRRHLQEKDVKLINYLASHDHISPFHHTFITLRVKAPVFVARQLVKHEYMPWNEVSRRYVDSEPEFYFPTHWRERSSDRKQGSGENHPNSDFWNRLYPELCRDMLVTYKEAIEDGVCPEQARMILPQNMMTEWYWSGTLSAFAKMLKLRLPEDTQKETRDVAEKTKDIIMPIFPVSLSALLEEY